MEKISFEKLVMYQKGLVFSNAIYDLTKAFPADERFGLTDQLRRASVSIIANIAEGVGRYHTKELIQFLRVSRSSAFECVALLQIASKQKYLNESEYNTFYNDIKEITKMISGYINSIK